jgi:hypothetical protein
MPQLRRRWRDTPLGFRGGRGLLRANCGGEAQLTAPNAFARWMDPLNASGLETERVHARRVTSNFGRSR